MFRSEKKQGPKATETKPKVIFVVKFGKMFADQFHEWKTFFFTAENKLEAVWFIFEPSEREDSYWNSKMLNLRPDKLYVEVFLTATVLQ